MAVAALQLCFLSAILCFLSIGEAAMVDSVGREFVFAYPKPYFPTSRYSSYSPAIYLVITNPTSTTFSVDVNLVTISPPSSSLIGTREVTNSRPANITIPVISYFGIGWRTSPRDPLPTVKVTASGPASGGVSVHAYYSYNQRYSTWYAMGTVILPTKALGKDHFIASYRPITSHTSEFTVTAASEQATVTIRATDGFRARKTLEPYETFQYTSTHDLTGSQVSADKPIAVMAGVSAAKIPEDNIDYSNYLLAQMPSVSGLGTSYILAPFRERTSGYVFRVVATQDNTQVAISNGKPTLLHAGELINQVLTTNNITFISADKPILVAQYIKGYSADTAHKGNAAMVVVPAIEMFSSTVAFPVTSLPSKAPQFLSLSITIKCDDSAGLIVDGAVFAQVYTKLIGPRDMCILQSGNLDAEAPHVVSHSSSDVMFSVMVVGLGYKVGYLYMAGYNVRSRASITEDNSTDVVVPPENSKGMVLVCEDDQMTLFLNKSLVIDGVPNDVHLNDPHCFGRLINARTGRWIRLQALYSECGTDVEESQSGSIYKNNLIYKGPRDGSLIGRDATFNLPITCTFNDRALASLQVAPELSVINGSLSGRGALANVTFSLKMYQSISYQSAYRQEEFPVTVKVGKPIYLEARATSGGKITLMVETCLATHSADPRQKPNYIFIDNGCATDETVTFYSDEASDTQRFSTIAFTLSDESTTTVAFIHCWLLACNASEETSRCQRDCDTRERRESDSAQSADRYVVSWGPLIIVPESTQEHDMGHAADSKFQFAPLVASVAIFIVSVIIAAFGTVAYLRSKRKTRQSSPWYDSREDTYELLKMEDPYE